MREEIIGDCRLILGDCLEVMPTIGKVDHIISDPPYEKILHDSNKKMRKDLRKDSGPSLKLINFSSIDAIRDDFVNISNDICEGWFIVFCTVEGVLKWANVINESDIKYKRACAWIKPDSTPQMNGQKPAQGFECFITAWAGKGFSKWNGGGKRGVYTHCVNATDRHGVHPTEKPWRLFSEIVTDFTKKNQTILDPFAGSGTTGVACAKLGRKFIGIELDEEYFDIACKRIEEAYKQPDLFVEQPTEYKQDSMI